MIAENEQLRTALENVLEENAKLLDERQRLSRRVSQQARQLLEMAAKLAPQTENASAAADERLFDRVQNEQQEEELRVALEEMQVLAEELEVANDALTEANRSLEQKVSERTAALAATNTALQVSESRFRSLVQGIPQLVWRAAGQGLWTWCSTQWTDLTALDLSESAGEGWLNAVHLDDRDVARHAWREAPLRGYLDIELRMFRAAEGRYGHYRTRALPRYDEGGDLIEWLGTCTDVDDMRRMQEHQKILVGELQHRTRNLIAVIQAILQRTLRNSETLQEFEAAALERLAALARTQSLLSRADGAPLTLAHLLRDELSAHFKLDAQEDPARIVITGDETIALPPNVVQPLAMALHELATNAVKYGAFSFPAGRLEVRWVVEQTERHPRLLTISWSELGVPTRADPQPKRGGGNGRHLIERALPYQTGGETQFRLAEDGLRCVMRVPV
ncbi:hypothetical protein Acid7E03_36380 [Acidisoma sp. 7E03]